MNVWDLFTWFNCGLLAFAAIIIFGFFCRDAGGVLAGQREDPELDPASASPPPGEAPPGSGPDQS